MIFDKKICINNIKYLAKKKNIKLGDLENDAQVSAGYFSRINKEESAATPSIEVLCSICTKLDISIDTLIKYDLEALSPTEEYLVSFLSKLASHTLDNLISWEKDTYNEIKAYLDAEFPYPVMKREKKYDDFNNRYYYQYNYSSMFDDKYCVLAGDVFHFCFNESDYFLARATPQSDAIGAAYEFYVRKKFLTYKICNGIQTSSDTFYSLLHNLYLLARKNACAVKLSDDIKDELDLIFALDDLPF